MSALRPDPNDSPQAGPGPVVLLLPLVALLLGILWARHGTGGGTGARPAPPEAEQGDMVEGWVGAASPGSGARLEVRLVPLHGDADRQVFDRDVLASRLGRTGGQPWQLDLRYSCAFEVASPALVLEPLEVSDARGAILSPLVDRAPVPPGEGVTDPLLSLLAAPVELARNTRLTVVLWGDEPGEDARLSVGGLEVSLRGEPVASDSIPRTLARLERRGRR